MTPAPIRGKRSAQSNTPPPPAPLRCPSPPIRIVVVAGTDTNIGKTYVTCALARLLRATAIKLIETGSDEDGIALSNATKQSKPTRALLRLRDPLAPAVAADREGVTIDLAA